MTLPDDTVFDLLREEFVLGWTNIEREEHVGLSHGYAPRQSALGTTNGAGGRNVQLLVLSPDRVVLHVLPGFWHPEDLAAELRFAKQVHRLWLDPKRDRAGKEAMYRRLHQAEIARQSPLTTARSDWQSFDRHEEVQRCGRELRDTMLADAHGYPVMRGGTLQLKPLNVLTHERMMARPFQTLDEFDLEAFVDYGRVFYDINHGDKGKTFVRAERRAAEREREAERARRAAERRTRR